jgi:hypothetical protein
MNTHTNDGGPAFPSPAIESATDDRREQRDGMSLRDYFAAKAMQAMVSSEYATMVSVDTWSKDSYRIADAMLKAREVQS